ncbi:MAG: C40 family peptidase [Bacteroidia bacterium]
MKVRGIWLIRSLGGLVALVGGCSIKPTKASASSKYKAYRSTQEKVVAEVRSYLGVPYKFGGMDRKGVDCSGLVCRVYLDAAGLSLPRTADAQAQVGEPVEKAKLRPGDLVFFKEPKAKNITHVGIVHKVEGGEVSFIHAASGRRQVVEDRLSDPHWQARFVCARRPIPLSKADPHNDPQEKSYSEKKGEAKKVANADRKEKGLSAASPRNTPKEAAPIRGSKSAGKNP